MCPTDVLARLDALAACEERAWVRVWAVVLGIGAACGFVLNGLLCLRLCL